MKKTILRSFFRGHPFSLHAKFQVSYSTPSRFVKKMTYFCIIFAEKYFPAKYLRFYTSTKNFSKIRPKMSKRQPIKKNFFYLFPLLTYSALQPLNFILRRYVRDIFFLTKNTIKSALQRNQCQVPPNYVQMVQME